MRSPAAPADDRILGGPGNDFLLIGDHDPSTGVPPSSGDDSISGGPGNDDLVGDSYTDDTEAFTGNGHDRCHGDAGEDFAATCEVLTSIEHLP